MPYLKEARDKGATIVVIDPRATRSPGRRTSISPLRPGTDLPRGPRDPSPPVRDGCADQAFLERHADRRRVAARAGEPWTFERPRSQASLPTAARQLAELYATASPALVKCGWGLERNRNGGSAAAAVLALPAVAGKFGVRGGGYSMSNSASWDIEPTWLRDHEPPTRAVNMNNVGRALTAPTARPSTALFVYNCNPVATLPDQARVLEGLAREDLFTVVFDQVMTDTARTPTSSSRRRRSSSTTTTPRATARCRCSLPSR